MLAFSRAVTGLRIAEQNLYVTSNNLSNVETEGYHRQRLNQFAFKPESRGNLYIGLGVDADSISQTRLEFLETNYRNELAPYGEFKLEDKVYTSLQSIIGDDGSFLQDTLHDLWESFNELSKEYTTTIAGTYLRENAVSLIAEFDGINDQLDKMQNELDTEIENVVRKINDYSSQIAMLNKEITESEADGSLSCELRDSRDSIIANLSELIDITVEHATDTCVNIRTTNGYLVVRTESNRVATDKIVSGSIFRSPVWELTGEPLEVTSGELKGILDMRGGDVIGNLEHSTNGAPKDKMDVVISIDTKMDHSMLAGMADNIANMLNIMDRQDVNYQLYLTNGKSVTAHELKYFSEYLYAESAKLQINNYSNANQGTETISGLQQYINNLYGEDSKLSSDIWGYIDGKADFTGLKGSIAPDKLAEVQEQLDGFSGKTLKEFSEYLNDIKDTNVASTLKSYLNDYIDNEISFNLGDLENYIDDKYEIPASEQAKVNDIIASNLDDALGNIDQAAIVDFRPDSNKYLMIFTDNAMNNSITQEEIAEKLNKIDMDLIAVTDESVKVGWNELIEKTGGTVLDILELSTEDGAEDIGLQLTRNFNSRLIGADTESGIAYFRSALNSLLNGLVREINGVLRQGVNGNGHRHGEEMLDEFDNPILDSETGEPMYYNLDMFVKIEENLPFQMGNIKINPAYDDVMNIPLSYSGATGDFQIGNMLVDLTETDVFNNKDSYATFDEHYANFILEFGQAANAALTGYEAQESVLTTTKERISQVSGVSMDEELSNMVKFQHSYTAASKMIRVIDEMLETIISM